MAARAWALRTLPFAVALALAPPDAGGSAAVFAPGTLGVRILADTIAPTRLVPGQVATRVVVVSFDDGVHLSWPSTLDLDDGAEPLRSATVQRKREGSGRVRLTLEYPFLTWTPGEHRVGALRIGVEEGERRAAMTLPGRRVHVEVGIPVGDAMLATAPPAAPLPSSGTPWGALVGAPLLLAVVSGLGWWRAARAGPDAPGVATPVHEPDPRDTIAAALAAAEEDPVATLLHVAGAARRIPALVQAGATRACSTSELVAIAAAAAADLERPLAGVLGVADAVRYGARPVDSSTVRRLGRELMEVLDRA